MSESNQVDEDVLKVFKKENGKHILLHAPNDAIFERITDSVHDFKVDRTNAVHIEIFSEEFVVSSRGKDQKDISNKWFSGLASQRLLASIWTLRFDRVA